MSTKKFNCNICIKCYKIGLRDKKEVRTFEEAKKAAAAKKAALAKANTQSSSSMSTQTTSQSLGITLSYLISGKTVSSGFGSRSSIRSSAHTGLDISAPYGTPLNPQNYLY